MRTLYKIIVAALVATSCVSVTPALAEIGITASDGRIYTLLEPRPETALIPGEERIIKSVECEYVDFNWRFQEKRCSAGERVVASKTAISVIRSDGTTNLEERVDVWFGIIGLALVSLALILTLTVEKNKLLSKMSIGALLWMLGAPWLCLSFTSVQVKYDLPVFSVVLIFTLMFAGSVALYESYRVKLLIMSMTVLVGMVIPYLII